MGVALEGIKASASPPGDEAGSTGPIEKEQTPEDEEQQQKATQKAKTTAGPATGSASRFRALVLIGVAAAICAAAIPHMTAKPCGASKPPEAQHAVACSPQWLPVLLSLSSQSPVAPLSRLFGQLSPLEEPPRAFMTQAYDALKVPRGFALCEAHVRGIHVQYVQIWKADTQGICAALAQMHDHGNTSSDYVFTFVRPPIEKFVSGFSEIAWRASVQRSNLNRPTSAECIALQHALGNVTFSAELTAKSQAQTFLADFIRGVATTECFGPDALHTYPSTAFMSAALRNNLVPRIDFVGRLDRFVEDWRQLMHLIGVEPQPLHSQNHHPHTSADSGFRPREEMTTYLAQSPESTLQLCFVFLPDFVCLNYPLPPACHKLASSGVIAEICATCNRAGNASLFSAAPECEGAARNLASQPQCAARRSWNTDVFQVTGVNPQYPEKTPGLQEWLTQCNGVYQEGLECHNTSVALVADQLIPSTMSPDRRTAVTGVLFLRITGCFSEFMRAEHFLSHPSRPIQAWDHWDAYLKSGGDTPIAGERIPIPPPCAIGAVLLAYEYLKDAVPFSNLPALYRVEDSINQFAYSFEEWLLCSRPDAQQAARHQTNTQLLAVSTSACADKMLIPGQELTLTVHLTFSGNGKSIWGWRTPERNGYLRWEVLPAHGHDSITCGMPIAPLAAKRNYARCGTVPYDEAGMDTGEVILLPGSRFVIESVQGPTNTTRYTTVSARQRPTTYPDRIG